jgi:arylsulfatase A-like enzyme
MYGGYRYLNENRSFLASTVRDAGLETVGYHSNPHLGPEKNYNNGFDRFNDGAEDADNTTTLKNLVDRHVPPDSRLYSLLRRIWHFISLATDTSAYAKAPTISDRAIDWLEQSWNGEDDFFMWLHYMDVHYPFTPPEEFLEEIGAPTLSNRRIADLNGKMQENEEALTDDDVADLLTLYDGEIRFADHHIGRVLDALKEHSVFDDTAIVITADHGEGFGEHGRFGHHPELYDELLRVPLVMNGPQVPSMTINNQVSLVDIPSTIYESIGIDAPEANQGKSLDPLIRGENEDKRAALITSRGGDHLACRTEKWKCFWRIDVNEVELYDLSTDPAEERDVSNSHQDVVSELQDIMETHLVDSEATDVELPEIEEDQNVKQRLRDLGYTE